MRHTANNFWNPRHCALVLLLCLSLIVSRSIAPDSAFGAPESLRSLSSFIQTLINKPQFRSANWGVKIIQLDSGDEIFSYNAEKLFLPASNRKLFTTALALDRLGSAFRYKTYLLKSGDVSEQGYLRGDLIVKASGDPSIGNAVNPAQRPDSVFRQWAAALKGKGIRYVRGNIIIDCSAFDEEGVMGPGWAWDYQPDNYAPHVSAFAYNQNEVAIIAKPGAQGEPCAIRKFPSLSLFTIVNDTMTVAQNSGYGLHITREYGTNNYHVEGKMLTTSKEESQLLTVAVPELVAGESLKASLQEQGITIRGSVKISYVPVATKSPTADETMSIYESPELSQLIRHMNKNSDNFFAEQIYKSISASTAGKGSYGATQNIEERFLSRIGIDPRPLSLADGSGLSRLDLVSPDSVVQLMRYMHGSKDAKAFFDSLPVSGKDGTLRGRMGDAGMAGRVIAKTGTMARANCLSGYVRTQSGETLVFSIMANNFSCSNGEVSFAQDKILEALAHL
jgi:D-alanyl-D-alanine carboxypeptidase/D-alanyl-D-alanine-endopeptidase (penicillin-binding protein 4)